MMLKPWDRRWHRTLLLSHFAASIRYTVLKYWIYRDGGARVPSFTCSWFFFSFELVVWRSSPETPEFKFHQIRAFVSHSWRAWIQIESASKIDSLSFCTIHRRNGRKSNEVTMAKYFPACTFHVDEQRLALVCIKRAQADEYSCARSSIFSSLSGKFVILTRQKNANNNNCFFVYFFRSSFAPRFVFHSHIFLSSTNCAPLLLSENELSSSLSVSRRANIGFCWFLHGAKFTFISLILWLSNVALTLHIANLSTIQARMN